MNQVDQLLQALAQRQQMYDQSYGNVLDTQKRSMDANSQRYHRGLFGMGEAIYDAIRRPKADREYNDSLVEAMKSARGVDDITAQLQAMQEAAALEERRAYDASLSETEHRRKVELQRQRDEASMERTKARGNPANVTYNIPSGFMPVDPNDPTKGIVPIPGSKEALEIEAARAKDEQRDTSARAKYSSILDEVDQAIGKISGLTSGFIGKGMSNVPGTDAYTLSRHLDTIKGNLGFDRLQQMREESKTGGALGQVSNIELNLLTSSLTNLDPGLPPEQLQRNLEKVQNHYRNFLSALDGRMPEGYDEQGNPVGESGGESKDKAVRVSTPAEAQALKPGTRYITPDGQEYIR